MAATLIDTNVLLRLLQPQHRQYAMASAALAELQDKGASLCIAPQNLVEFWVVATRPVANNGLGMNPLRTVDEVQALHGIFRLLEGEPGVADAWERLAGNHMVSGKQAHDAHLVAIMSIYGVTDILTFNISDLKRYSGIKVLDPAQFRGTA